MHTNAAKQFLQEMLMQQQDSVKCYTFNQQSVWIKKAGSRHSIWLYRAMGTLTSILGVKALTPVPNVGGAKAIQIEAQRLQELAQKHINVPELLAVDSSGLMMSDLGDTHIIPEQYEHILKTSSTPSDCLQAFIQVACAVKQTHQKGAWLSEGFLRNILRDAHQQIAFIDFESDPIHYMDQEYCYARDWLCVMFSSAIYLRQHDLIAQACDHLNAQLQYEPVITRSALLAVAKRINWLNKLPLSKLGKDGERLEAVIQLLLGLDTTIAETH